jgi:hypothetical protein
MALAIKPNYAHAGNGRGVALVELGQDAAATSCDEGLTINPDCQCVFYPRCRTGYSLTAYGSSRIFQ